MSEHDSIQRELVKLKKKIENKLHEYGSLELVARLIYVEMVTLPDNGNVNPLRERPFLPYLLGLLLTNNNLKADKPSYEQITELLNLLNDYLNKFDLSLLHLSTQRKTQYDFIKFSVDQLKIENDLDLGSYLGQKDEYYRRVFAPLDQYFQSKYGFTVEYAYNFVAAITKTILKEMNQLSPRNENIADVLTINTNDFCNKHNVKDKNMFEKCLTAFSCSLGMQVDSFTDPLSDNIINSKPILKINDHTYFVSRVELDRRFDKILESLLEADRQGKPQVWDRFLTLRAKYLENAVYNCFMKVFPNQVYRNVHFTFQDKEYETDLLVIHGNKILIVESKSGSFPSFIGQDSMRSLKRRLTKLVKNVWVQGTNTKKYINSHDAVTFWKDKNKKNVLVKINSSKINYEFFVIGVTLVHMGDLVANLKNIQAFNFFTDNEYPWMVYLYDLDIIVAWLNTSEFIHYTRHYA